MGTIGENIKLHRTNADLSQEALGKKIGKTRSAISQYESGLTYPRMGVIEDMAAALGISKSQLIEDRSLVKSDYVEVPLFGSIAAGTPLEMLKVDDTFPIPAKVQERYPDGFLLKVVGESMNKVLPNGCYALVTPCSEVINGKPYAVCVNGYDATIKRVNKLENGFQLVPDSNDPTFPIQTFNFNDPDTDDISVIGRVVYYVLPFDWEI